MTPTATARSLRCIVLCLLATIVSVAGQTRPYKMTRQSDVIYARKFGVALTMEVFRGPARNGLGVLWVVSSSGRSSREQTFQESFERTMAPLVERGYTVFAVIHGSAPLFNLQDQVADVRRAVRFVRHQAREFGIDGQRLAISGSSAGGLLALNVATQDRNGNPASTDAVERESSQVQAVGCFFSPTDLLNFGGQDENIVELMQRRDGGIDPTFRFYELDATTGVRRPLNTKDEVNRMLQEYSPVANVSPDDPPTILIHGDQDRAVPVQQSRRLIERLNEANVPTRLVVREGLGHAYPGWQDDATLLADWFDTHLRRPR
jgi:acetyl esterase/lipase